MQRFHGMAQLLVRALLAPVPLADGMRHGAPAVPLPAFPVHQRQAVDVAFGQAASAAACSVGPDFIESEFAHGQLACRRRSAGWARRGTKARRKPPYAMKPRLTAAPAIHIRFA